jgi:hypothetical protein
VRVYQILGIWHVLGWEMISFDRVDPYPLIFIVLLTCQVDMPLGITSFCCDYVQGSTIDQNGYGGHQIQDQVKMIL